MKIIHEKIAKGNMLKGLKKIPLEADCFEKIEKVTKALKHETSILLAMLYRH